MSLFHPHSELARCKAYPARAEADDRASGTGRLHFVDVLADATVAASRSGDPELSVRFRYEDAEERLRRGLDAPPSA